MSGAAPPGRPTERTSLTWWRTAQTAIVCALILIRFERDQPVLAWIGAVLAVALAAACWFMARRRAALAPHVTARLATIHGSEVGTSAVTSHRAIIGVSVLVVALAVSVLAAVLLAV